MQSALTHQSAIVVALGNKLLVVTNSSSNQLTAARLIGNGADLAAGTVTGIKVVSVMGGAKGSLAVPVTNVGNAPLAGTVTVTVLLSPDPTSPAPPTPPPPRPWASA